MTELTRVEELQCYFSDYHKDFYGFRPRFGELEQWHSEEWLNAEIKAIDDAFARAKETFEGREQLRADGWYVEETDPELIERARREQEDRDRWYEQRERDLEQYDSTQAFQDPSEDELYALQAYLEDGAFERR